MTLTPPVLIEYDRAAPSSEETETATFGLGCFWGPDAVFGARDGVVRTRVGYAGGSKADPTYHALGDHTEVLQVEFDPDRLSYASLLELAFEEHEPRRQPTKRQYQNVILTASNEQNEAVTEFLAEYPLGRERVKTRIEPLETFYTAEAYHQKYNLRSKRWIADVFGEAGYDDTEIRESPAAAKLNAHVSGYDVELPFLDARERSTPG